MTDETIETRDLGRRTVRNAIVAGPDVDAVVEATYDEAIAAPVRRAMRRLLVDLDLWPKDRPQ